MMKVHKKLILVGGAALIVMVAATLGAFLGGAEAASAAADTTLLDNLRAQGLCVASVTEDPAADTLSVVMKSRTGGSPGDAWANTVIQREAQFLAQTGVLVTGSVTVTIVDEKGEMIYQWSGPVESQARPATKVVDPLALDGLKPDLAKQAEEHGVVLQNLSVRSDEAQGAVVEAEVMVPGLAGEARDAQIRWATLELMAQLRDHTETLGALVVDLFRISIEDADAGPLVEYVVDTTAKTVRAWMAFGVSPVWAIGSPSPGPASE